LSAEGLPYYTASEFGNFDDPCGFASKILGVQHARDHFVAFFKSAMRLQKNHMLNLGGM